jgi:hypothetical protein
MPYKDDPSISDNDALLRRVPIHPSQIVKDGNLGRYRPSSAAFSDHPDGSPMSVTLQTELENLGVPARQALIGYETTHVLVSFQASVARQYGQGIAREPIIAGIQTDPIFDAVQTAHGVVFGKKTKSTQRALAKAAIWVVAPSSLEIV